MFNYCAEENVFKKQEQFNTTNDGESINKQVHIQERKKETSKKKKGKQKTEIEAIAKFRHSTRAQYEL